MFFFVMLIVFTKYTRSINVPYNVYVHCVIESFEIEAENIKTHKIQKTERKTFIDFIEIDFLWDFQDVCVCLFFFFSSSSIIENHHRTYFVIFCCCCCCFFILFLHSFIFQRKSGRMIKIEHTHIFKWIKLNEFDSDLMKCIKKENLLQNEQSTVFVVVCFQMEPFKWMRDYACDCANAYERVPGRRVLDWSNRKNELLIEISVEHQLNVLNWWFFETDTSACARTFCMKIHHLDHRVGVCVCVIGSHTNCLIENHEHIILYHRNSMNADERERECLSARANAHLLVSVRPINKHTNRRPHTHTHEHTYTHTHAYKYTTKNVDRRRIPKLIIITS